MGKDIDKVAEAKKGKRSGQKVTTTKRAA